MSTCASQVLVQGPQCNVIEIITAGPQGATGPAGVAGPTGPVFSFGSSVSDTPSGTVNDYAPPGYVAGTTNKLVLLPGAPLTLDGIAAPTSDGFLLYLFNLSPSNSITFANQNGGSLPANQFLCPSASPWVLTPYTGTILIYELSVGIWTFGGVG